MPMHDVVRDTAAVDAGEDSHAMAARVRESFELALLDWQEDSHRAIVRGEAQGWKAIVDTYETQRAQRAEVEDEEREKRYLLQEISRGGAVQIVQYCKDVWRAFQAQVGKLAAAEHRLRQRTVEEEEEVFLVFSAMYGCEASARLEVEAAETRRRPAVERMEERARHDFEQFYLRWTALRRSVESAEHIAREGVMAAQAEAWSASILDARYKAWKQDLQRRKETQQLASRDEVTNCTGCRASFTLNFMAAPKTQATAAFKFNCRWCGDVFCDDCTKHRAELPLKGHPNEKVRVCDTCYLHHVAVSWKSDADVTHCGYCERKFNAIVRRHHCRSCGGIFCADCTANKTPLFDLGYIDPQLVCEPCALRRGVGVLAHAVEPSDDDAPQGEPHGIPFPFFRSRSSPKLKDSKKRSLSLVGLKRSATSKPTTPVTCELSYDSESQPEAQRRWTDASDSQSAASASPEGGDVRSRSHSASHDDGAAAQVRREQLIGDALRMVGTISHGDLHATLEHLRTLSDALEGIQRAGDKL